MGKYNLSKKFKRDAAEKYFKRLVHKEALIELREVKIKRSIDQNSLYWLWLTAIQHETGLIKEQLHLLYRFNFIPKSDEHVTKIIITELWSKAKRQLLAFHYFDGLEDFIDLISHSTTDLDTAQFAKYLESIKTHASAQMGVELLTQDQENFLEFAKEYNQYR